MDPAPSRSDALNELVVACLEALSEDGASAVEALLAEHPELEADARRRLEQLGRAGLLDEEESEPSAAPERLGEFRLLERLGGGGMGVVYRAIQEPLDREVALKLNRPEQRFFAGALPRFRREVEAVARLKHPGIVQIYAVGEAEGVPYFAMERVDGCTLGDALEALQGRDPHALRGADLARVVCEAAKEEFQADELPPLYAGNWSDTCARVVRAMAEALEHAHRAGVLHRDLKPSNVMLTPDGRVMLLDFGLASIEGTQRLTRTGNQVGSVPYLPPEVLSEADPTYDARADVYELGVTLYEALCLRLPYEAPSVVRLAQSIVEGRHATPASHNPDVPPELAVVCAVAMEREPARRYPSAEALAHDLSNVLERRPIRARATGLSLRLKRWVQRHPGEALAAVLASVLLVGGPSLFAWQTVRAARAVEQEGRNALRFLESALEAVSQSLVALGGAEVRDVPHLARKQRELLERALALYADIADAQAQSDASAVLGAELQALSDDALSVLAGIYDQLGELEQSRAAWQSLEESAERRLERSPTDRTARAHLAQASLGLASDATEAAELQRAQSLVQRGLTQLDADSAESADQLLRARLLQAGARARSRSGDNRGAIDALLNSLPPLQRAAERDPALVLGVAELELELGGLQFLELEREGARRSYEGALARLRARLESTDERVRTLDSIVRAHMNLGQLAKSEFDTAASLREYEAALAIQTDLARSFPDSRFRQDQLADAQQSLAIMLDFLTERRAEGYALLQEALATRERQWAEAPEQLDSLANLGRVQAALGTLCMHLGVHGGDAEGVPGTQRLEEARALYAQALDCTTRARALAPDDPELARALRRGHLGYADTWLADAHWEEALEQVRASAAVEPTDWIDMRMLTGRALACAQLCEDPERSAALLGEALAVFERSVDAGYTDLADMDGTASLEPLRALDGFAALRARVLAALEAEAE